MPSTPASPSVCPVCREDLGSVVALGAHYNAFHVVRDTLLVTRPSFQCSRCSSVFATEKRLKSHACSSGDQLLQARTIGKVAASPRRPQPSAWVIATDGSASPPSPDLPATAGWGFLVHRVGILSGQEAECWGEVLVDDKDPRSLGADSLTNNAGELWVLAEAFLWLRDESGDDRSVPVTLVYDSEVLRALQLNHGLRNRTSN